MKEDGPTRERRRHAGPDLAEVGIGRSNRRVYMLDNALAKALARHFISEEECSALGLYALHWLAGGLQGQLSSVDLNRIICNVSPANFSGLAKSEGQEHHRQIYWLAHDMLGIRPAFVADHVACYDTPIADVAVMLGYKSRFRGREQVKILLGDAGHRLARFFKESS